MVVKVVECDCGFVARSDSDDMLVAEVQRHANEHHKMNLSREQVLAMAQLDARGAASSDRGTSEGAD